MCVQRCEKTWRERERQGMTSVKDTEAGCVRKWYHGIKTGRGRTSLNSEMVLILKQENTGL